MEKITKLLSAEVVDGRGKRLGYVVDLRSEGDPEHGVTNENRRITELVYCRRRLLYFLGSQSADVRTVPWSSVQDLSPGRIVIDPSTIE